MLLKKLNKLILIFFISWLKINSLSAQADILIFSYNRPLQLYTLLESIEKYVKNSNIIYILYRASDNNYQNAYDRVYEKFPHTLFIKQSVTPTYNDFKDLTLDIFKRAQTNYILFAVDDIIVKDYCDLAECVHYLEKTKCYAFYLKMGLHLKECYAHLKLNLPGGIQPVPPYTVIAKNLFSWSFSHGISDWNYPQTVDLTLYRISDIYPVLEKLNFNSPNTLEQLWSQTPPLHPKGLFYAESKMVNLPLNMVQTDWANPTLNAFTPQDLLEKFNQGLKFDIRPYHQILNKDVHIDEPLPTFIQR